MEWFPISDGQEEKYGGTYVRFKSVAKGALDVALLMSNINILKAMVDVPANKEDSFYIPLMVIIIICIVLQAITGIMIIVLGAMKPTDDGAMTSASRLNKAILVLVAPIVVLEIIITALGVRFTNSQTA